MDEIPNMQETLVIHVDCFPAHNENVQNWKRTTAACLVLNWLQNPLMPSLSSASDSLLSREKV